MQLLMGLLPLVAFYAGEAYGGLKLGIAAAIVTSLLDVAYQFGTTRRINRMVVVSTGLVVVLGGLSLLSDDERFVLWTPVIGGVIFAGLLGGSLFAETSALELAMVEQNPDAPLDEPTRKLLRGVTWRFALNLLLHASLTAWGTTQPRETWLFVSGPLQYVMMGIQGLGEFWMVRQLPPIEDDAPPL